MRHLELPLSRQQDYESDVKSECSIEIKDEDLEVLDIKEDFMELPLDIALVSDVDIQTSLKTELSTDEESCEEAEPINSPKSNSSISSNSIESPIDIKLKIRSRRKSSQPQRAFQVSSNSTAESHNSNIDFEEYDELEEGEDDNNDIETDIFKGMKDETGEEFDEELQRNVKEEWKSHWGVKCNMCEKMFTQKSVFDKHYRTSYNTRPMYTCSYCDKTMDKYSTFRSHCYRHITEGRYKCYKCAKGFSLESTLHDHILAKHTEVKPFMCEECGKGFVTKPGLKIHLKKHKTDEKEDYPCAQCGKVLHTRGGLTAHMNVHRLGRRFMCDVCGKTFTQKVNMQQHVKHHSGERPHACDACGKRFAEKSHLARHRSFHSEKRPHRCDVCGKMYKTERCLKVHGMVHASSRPYVCSYCEKGFLSSTKLKQHLNIHTGQRPFKCKYCERTFTNYPNWLKHTRRRHKVDHKTGLGLVPPKEEQQEPVPTLPPLPPLTPCPKLMYSSQAGAGYPGYLLDYSLGRADDTALMEELSMAAGENQEQQTDNYFMSNTDEAHPVGLIVPCYNQEQFQNYLPSQQFLDTSSQQLSDSVLSHQYAEHFLHAQIIQQQALQM